MSSTAKYQLFQAAQDENKSAVTDREKDKKCLKTGLIVTAVVLISVSIATVIAIGVGVGVTVSQNEATTELTVITITDAELEGKYRSPDGSIRFQSTVNDTHVVLSIYTKDGELVVTINHPLVTNMTLMGINKTNFLIMEDQPGRPKYDDYLVPDDMMDTMDSMMHSGKMTNEMLQHLDNSTVNETRETMLHDLAMSPHAQVIIDAAQALGKLGIMGTDYKSVMQFYQLALQLFQTKNFIEEGEEMTLQKRNRIYSEYGQQHHVLNERSVQCSSNGATCSAGRCPYPLHGNSCFGMCGPQCTCWSFVCGNCCVQVYCRSHDQCCAEEGFFSSPCLSVAWRVLGSTCSQTYDCR